MITVLLTLCLAALLWDAQRLRRTAAALRAALAAGPVAYMGCDAAGADVLLCGACAWGGKSRMPIQPLYENDIEEDWGGMAGRVCNRCGRGIEVTQ